jgi:hypothetical protein
MPIEFDEDKVLVPSYLVKLLSTMRDKAGLPPFDATQSNELADKIKDYLDSAGLKTIATTDAVDKGYTLDDFEPDIFVNSTETLANLLRGFIKDKHAVQKYFRRPAFFKVKGRTLDHERDWKPVGEAIFLGPGSSAMATARALASGKIDFEPGIINAYIAKLLKVLEIDTSALSEHQGIRINLNDLKAQQLLNESFLGMFGNWAKYILKAMFGDIDIPVSVTGKETEVQALARALAGEKNYIETATRFGLANKQTYSSKSKLDQAIKNFEQETGIKWPFGM